MTPLLLLNFQQTKHQKIAAKKILIRLAIWLRKHSIAVNCRTDNKNGFANKGVFMAVTGISSSTPSLASSANKKADESLEQLAQQGDPTAIAELKALKQQETSQPTPQVGATEPGKGEKVDKYI
jgi:hypothetical protein